MIRLLLRKFSFQAKTLGDLRDEMIAEAKDKLGYVQDGLINAIEYFVEFPPVCWLVSSNYYFYQGKTIYL